MRLGLVLFLIGLPGAALAAEDRYGPSRSSVPATAVTPVAVSATPAMRAATDYRGRTLSWAGKSAVAAPVDPPAASAPPQVFASRGPGPAPLPTSLYDAPAPTSPAAVVKASAIATPPVYSPAPASPAPAPVPAQPPVAWTQPAQPSLPPPPSTPQLASAPGYGYSPPRSYSVVREWGGTPDRIPTPPAAAQFSGREVALDPNTLGAAAAQPDPASDDEGDEEAAQQQRDLQKQNRAKGGRQ
jgi:hypothetical protein